MLVVIKRAGDKKVHKAAYQSKVSVQFFWFGYKGSNGGMKERKNNLYKKSQSSRIPINGRTS